MWRRRPPDPQQARARAVRRLSRITNGQVLDWADEAAAAVWKALEDFRKDPGPDDLAEARRGLEMLLGAVDVLESRQGPPPPPVILPGK
jgi:hypothetical protein